MSITSSESPGPTANSPIPININFFDGVDKLVIQDFTTTNGSLTNLQRLAPNFDFFEHLDLADFQVKANAFDYLISGLSTEEYVRKKMGKAIVAIDVNSANEIFYLTYSNGLYKFNPGGTDQLIISGTSFSTPLDFVISSKDQFIIADKEKYLVNVFNANGSLAYTIGGSMGKDGNEFYGPTGLAIGANDRLYVSDAFTGTTTGVPDQVKIYDIGQNNFTFIVRYSASNGVTIKDPYRIAVDKNGFVYLSDSGGDSGYGRVLIFDEKNEWIKTIQGGEQGAPGSLVVDNYGYLYVIDYEEDITFSGIFENPVDLLSQFDKIKSSNYVINVYNPDYTFLKSINEGLHLPIDLAINSCGKIIANDLELGGTVNLGIYSVDANFNFNLNFYTRQDNFYGELVPVSTGKVELELKDKVLFNCSPQPTGYFSIIYEVKDEKDLIPPVFSSCENIVQNNDPGECGAKVTFSAPQATDNSGEEPEVVQTAGLTSGSVFPVGTSVVTFTATDAAQNTSECNFEIIVNDTEAPKFTSCPGDITETVSLGATGKIITYQLPEFTDNCTGTTLRQIDGLASGEEFPLGETHVIFEVEDASGKTAICSFAVTISEENDTEKPVFTDCPSNMTVANDPGECGAKVTFSTPQATDNSGEEPNIVQTGGLPSGSVFPVGISVVTFTATDAAQNTSECSFEVIVNDSEAPKFTFCPGDITETVSLDATGKFITYQLPEFTDNCTGTTLRQIDGPASGEEFPLGETDVIFEVEDASGKTATCSFTVTISEENDTEKPVFDCPSNVTFANDPGKCGAEVTFLTPQATDNSGEDPTVVQTAGPTSGAFFPVGNTTVTFKATDASDNTAECSFSIIVIDDEAPLVETCPQNISETLVSGAIGKMVSYEVPKFSDNCELTSVELTSGYNSGEEFPIGDTQVTYVASDASGKTATCSFIVSVSEKTAPGNAEITCSDVTLELDVNGNATLDPSDVFESSTSDLEITNYKLSRDSFTCQDLDEPKSVTLSVTFSDGKTANCTSTVTVVDNIKPEVVCTPLTVQLNALGTATVTAEEVGAGSTDNCGINEMFLDKTAFTTADVGEQTVNLTVIDKSGHQASCKTTITVEPYEESPGGVICPEDATIFLDEEGEVKELHVKYEGSAELEFTLSRTYFTCADIGTHDITVSWTGDYTDSCTSQVTIVDNTPPEITCVGNLSLRLNSAGTAELDAEDVVQSVYDNCGIAGMSLDKTTFSTADLGTQQVKLRVTDESGNPSFCEFTVEILPFEEEGSPFTCADSVVVELNENGVGSINPRDLYSGGTGSVEFTLSKEEFSCDDLGEQTVVFSYSTPEDSGSCEIKVLVKDPLKACVQPPPVEPPENDVFLILYPNPSGGKVEVIASAKIKLERAEVFDMRGRFLFSRNFSEDEIKIYHLDLNELQSGVYNIKFFSKEEEYLRRAIIRND